MPLRANAAKDAADWHGTRFHGRGPEENGIVCCRESGIKGDYSNEIAGGGVGRSGLSSVYIPFPATFMPTDP